MFGRLLNVSVFFNRFMYLEYDLACKKLFFFSDVEENESSMICPCCQRIFHVDCVQSMALSYGRAHIKCPTCGEKTKFSDEALYQGVYIPEKDAAWDNPTEESFYNFQQMGQLYAHCDAKPCGCTKGPKFNLAGSRFEVPRFFK